MVFSFEIDLVSSEHICLPMNVVRARNKKINDIKLSLVVISILF